MFRPSLHLQVLESLARSTHVDLIIVCCNIITSSEWQSPAVYAAGKDAAKSASTPQADLQICGGQLAATWAQFLAQACQEHTSLQPDNLDQVSLLAMKPQCLRQPWLPTCR